MSDLFGWAVQQQSATAIIIAWPLGRDIGRVRHVARLLLAKPTERQRDTYWTLTCNRLTASLLRNGLSEDQVTQQLGHFHAAVSAEMARQQHGRQQA